jgi:hypothetical protein
MVKIFQYNNVSG